jgi:amino acid transporter
VSYGLASDGMDVTSVLIMALPPIMFTFDGFLFASNLQHEAKSKKTYPIALVTGIGTISVLYLMIAIGTIETASIPPLFDVATLQTTLAGLGEGTYMIQGMDANGVMRTYEINFNTEQYNALMALNPAQTSHIIMEQHLSG